MLLFKYLCIRYYIFFGYLVRTRVFLLSFSMGHFLNTEKETPKNPIIHNRKYLHSNPYHNILRSLKQF